MTVSAPCGELTGSVKDGVLHVYNIDYARAEPFAPSTPVTDGPHEGTQRKAPDQELVVTVTAPQPAQQAARGGEAFPILLWIHGGRYEFGHPSEPWTDSTSFAKNGIVTIAIGYRKNLSGFWRDSPTETYRAVDDIFLALDWVQRNAPSFGGDLSNVTVSGQSAGAGLALSMASDPRADGRVHRVIAMSPAFSLLSGSTVRRLMAGIGIGARPSTGALARAGKNKVDRAQRLVAAVSPSDPAVGPRFDSFSPRLPTLITATSEEFFDEPPVKVLDHLPTKYLFARGYAKTHGAVGPFPAKEYGARPCANVISDSAIRSSAVKVAERTVAAGHDVWAAQFEPGRGMGYAQRGRTSGAPHCIDLARFFGRERNHPFHQVAIDFVKTGTTRLPQYSDDRAVTTWAGADDLAVESVVADAWEAPRKLFGA
nr:carboxylesterase family protein [Corynebacterium lactis]